jgi:hypothetical protein
MLRVLRRMGEPLVRLASVEEVDHEPTFEAFADRLARRIVEERVAVEPRVARLFGRLVR